MSKFRSFAAVPQSRCYSTYVKLRYLTHVELPYHVVFSRPPAISSLLNVVRFVGIKRERDQRVGAQRVDGIFGDRGLSERMFRVARQRQ